MSQGALDQWLAWALDLERIYQEELGRSCWSDPEAFVNWTWHWNAGQSPAWIRDRIRESLEWLLRHEHPTPSAPPPDRPSQPTPTAAAPDVNLGQSRVIPVTTDADGPFAPRMMSDRANAWVSGSHAYVFAGSRATGGPLFFDVDLQGGHVTPLGPMVPYVGETEFWYWTLDGSVMVAEGQRLHRINPFTGADDVVLDISAILPGHTLDQWHSSDDGGTHSATVKDAAYQKVGTITVHNGKLDYWPKVGVLDESQVRRDGKGVLIKEDRGSGDDNRYIEFADRETYWRRDQDRGIGHSDMGPNYVVGEADKPDPGACVIWNLDRPHETPHVLFHTTNMGYISCRGGRCLLSDPTHISLVAMDGSGVTPLIEHGGGSSYDDRVKANSDPTGRVATFMRNGAVYLLVLS